MKNPTSRKYFVFKRNLSNSAYRRYRENEAKEAMRLVAPVSKPEPPIPDGLVEYYQPTIKLFFEEYCYDGTYTLCQLASLLDAKLNDRYNCLISTGAIINSWTRFKPMARVSDDRTLIEVVMGGKVVATMG